jgi:hypothetical protein
MMDDALQTGNGWDDPTDDGVMDHLAATAELDYEEGEAATDPPTDEDTDYPPPGGSLRPDRDFEEGQASEDPPTDPDSDYPPPPPHAGNNGR